MRFKNLKPLAIVTVCLVFAMQVLAQTGTSGRVVNKEGNGIPGVTVSSGGKVVTTTDANGNFTTTTGTGRLSFSSVGYETTTASAGSNNVTIVMATAVSTQQDIVVVGYGTRRIKDATGSVAAITAKDFNKGQISTPEQLFQGRTPGVTVTPSSGEPGAAAIINIRGSSAIRGNQEPLYVVDGVPLDGGATTGSASGAEGGTTPKNPLMFLNPNDIESVNILKDASSAAIYGARGANGVIIITTKNGRGAKGAFTLGMTTSISKTASRYDLLNGPDFASGLYNLFIKNGATPAQAANSMLLLDQKSNTDWQDQIFRTGVSQNINLGWGFSRNKTSLRLSGSYDNQQGIIKKSALKRFTTRANFTQNFLSNDKLRLEATMTYSNVKNTYVANTNNAGYLGSLIGAALKFNPTFPILNPTTGFYFQDPAGSGARNPVQLLNDLDDKDNVNRFLTNISLSYKILNGLTFKTTLGYDKADGKRTAFADPRFSNSGGGNTNVFGVDYGNSIAGNGRATVQNNTTKGLLFENTLTYNKVFNSRHDVNAVLGTSYQKSEFDYSGEVYWKLTTPVVGPNDVFNKNLNAFVNKNDAYVPGYGKSELNSYFTRINYILDDKYLLTATLRVDGSSKFGKNNRYGVFPAFAAKWKLLNENFAKPLTKYFNELSIRANWGKLGSQDGLDAYSAVELQQTWFTNLARTTTGTQLIHQGNDELKWEEAQTTGVGLDIASKDRRFTGTVDYYVTKRKNLIFFGPTPGGFSASTNYFFNLPGFVFNTGLEFSLNYQIIRSNKFTWSTNYNMSFYKNELKDYNKPPINTGRVNGQGLTGAYAQTIRNGKSLFTWIMPVFEGFDNNGNAIYANGGADQFAGSALPTFNAGLTNNFTYGRWNASIFLNASTGFYVYNNTANALFLQGSFNNGGNVTYDVLNSNESKLNPGSVSTRFLEKGDFLRLSNASIGYDFNIKSKVIRSLNATLSGQNLFLITNYSGLDPEVNVDKAIDGTPSRGFDYAGYPKARIFSIGLNVGF